MSELGNKDIMSENIQRFMAENKVDRNELADALAVPYPTVSDWINAKTYPRIDRIEKMAKFFGVSKSDLIEKPAPSDGNGPKSEEDYKIITALSKLSAEKKRLLLLQLEAWAQEH